MPARPAQPPGLADAQTRFICEVTESVLSRKGVPPGLPIGLTCVGSHMPSGDLVLGAVHLRLYLGELAGVAQGLNVERHVEPLCALNPGRGLT